MKYFQVILMALVAVIFTSCNKTDSTTTLAANSWSVGTTTYTAARVYRNTANTSLTMEDAPATGGQVNQLSFGFNSYPTATGTYTIEATNALSPNQMSVTAVVNNNGVQKVYRITPDDAPTATVTVANGKLSVSITNYMARNVGGNDSVLISANATEP